MGSFHINLSIGLVTEPLNQTEIILPAETLAHAALGQRRGPQAPCLSISGGLLLLYGKHSRQGGLEGEGNGAEQRKQDIV